MVFNRLPITNANFGGFMMEYKLTKEQFNKQIKEYSIRSNVPLFAFILVFAIISIVLLILYFTMELYYLFPIALSAGCLACIIVVFILIEHLVFLRKNIRQFELNSKDSVLIEQLHIAGESLIIKNKVKDVIYEIKKENVDNVLFMKHSIVIKVLDKKVVFLPNNQEIKELIVGFIF